MCVELNFNKHDHLEKVELLHFTDLFVSRPFVLFLELKQLVTSRLFPFGLLSQRHYSRMRKDAVNKSELKSQDEIVELGIP